MWLYSIIFGHKWNFFLCGLYNDTKDILIIVTFTKNRHFIPLLKMYFLKNNYFTNERSESYENIYLILKYCLLKE